MNLARPTVVAVVIDAYSFGGGVQSTAMLCLAASGDLPVAPFIFSNVGDRAENPDTIRYVAEHAVPFAAGHGIPLVQRRWVTAKGQERDLYDDLVRMESTIDIPVRLGSGDFANRKCTARYKIEVVARHLRQQGYSVDNPAMVALGISTDEIQRAHPGVVKQQPWTSRTYPLLDLGLSRTDCERVIGEAGLPPAPKSSCWFCPFKSVQQWRDTPVELVDRAEALEDRLNDRRERMGRDRVGLLSPKMRLRDAIDYQGVLFGSDCDSGWCFT